MLGLQSFLTFAVLLALLRTNAAAAAASAFDVPRPLRQTTRREVVQRMSLHPDGTWTAKRQETSPIPTCGTQAGGGTFQCNYDDYCQQQISGGTKVAFSTAASFDTCLAACDSTLGCNSVSYQSTTGACTEYSTSDPTLVPSANYESAVFDPNSHGSHPGEGTCGCNYFFYCQTQVISTSVQYKGTEASLAACAALCDTTTDCNTATYQFSTGSCTLYTAQTPTFLAKPGYESIQYDPEVFCPGPCFPPP